MDSPSPWHWIALIFFVFAWSIPLGKLGQRAGHSPVWGWIAGTIGLLALGLGPLLYVWWLAMADGQDADKEAKTQ